MKKIKKQEKYTMRDLVNMVGFTPTYSKEQIEKHKIKTTTKIVNGRLSKAITGDNFNKLLKKMGWVLVVWNKKDCLVPSKKLAEVCK